MSKQTKLTISVFLIIALALMLTGCGGQNTRTANANNNGSANFSDQVYEWDVQSVFPSGFSLYKALEHYVADLEKATGGRLKINLYPAGAVVPALEVLDAVESRALDAAHGSEVLWHGKFSTATFFGSFPMIFDPFMFLTWMYERDGMAYLDKAYKDLGLNIVQFPMGTIDAEILAWSHVPLADVDDWKGLKYRTIGWWGDILREAEVSVTALPSGEIFPALERRVVDAAEYSTPINDYDAGLYELAQYFTGPGIHQPFTSLKLYINQEAWNELPADIKAIVEMVSKSHAYSTWSWEVNASIDALEHFINIGKTPIYLNEDAQEEIRKITWNMLDEKAKNDPFFKEVWTSIQDFYNEYHRYSDFMRMASPKTDNSIRN